MHKSFGVIVLGCSALGAAGCKDISRFSTAPGELYCGTIVGASFVRRGFAEGVGIRMTFDADHLSDAPGKLSTSDGLLTDTPMRPLPELSQDPLSTFNFGEGRDRNFLYAVDPVDPAKGPTVSVIVSLLHDGDAEVRLIRGAPGSDGGAAIDGAPLFGVFTPLARTSQPCSF